MPPGFPGGGLGGPGGPGGGLVGNDGQLLGGAGGATGGNHFGGSYDPEGLFKEAEYGDPGYLINKNQVKRAVAKDSDLKEKMEQEKEKALRELEAARAARSPPEDDPAALVEYLLDTEADEMTFEITRSSPFLNEAFLAHVKAEISDARLGKNKDDGRVLELEALLGVVEDGLESLAREKSRLIAPVDRLKKLLQAKDKKQAILDMASRNEIDPPFMALLQQNINMAKQADQTQAAEFMEKVRVACQRYSVKEDLVKEAEVVEEKPKIELL